MEMPNAFTLSRTPGSLEHSGATHMPLDDEVAAVDPVGAAAACGAIELQTVVRADGKQGGPSRALAPRQPSLGTLASRRDQRRHSSIRRPSRLLPPSSARTPSRFGSTRRQPRRRRSGVSPPPPPQSTTPAAGGVLRHRFGPTGRRGPSSRRGTRCTTDAIPSYAER